MDILQRNTSGVLALCGKDMMPYAVPLSHAVDESRLIFHCAKEGHKLDLIRENCNASFCVIDQDEVHPERFTTYFRSVIFFGRIRIMKMRVKGLKPQESLAVVATRTRRL